jgi:heat-inducible transcriptional repressor
VTLTERQKAILMAIIEEYMENAQEVGSVQLVNKYGFKVSSATVRNEMVRLMDLGYLGQSHVSSGRIPTDLAIRMYVNEKVGSELENSQSIVAIKQGIFRVRFYPEKMTREILRILVEQTKCASFVLLDDMSRHYGVSSLMNYEEMREITLLQRVLDLLEDESLLKSVFSRYDGDEVAVLIGSELGLKDLDDCTLAFTKFEFWDNRIGHMGVVGSKRMDYRNVIPTISEVRNSVESSLRGWN